MNHRVNYLEQISSAHIEFKYAFDPAEFIDYDTEEEVIEEIKRQMENLTDLGMVELGHSEVDLDIPEDFWLEWHNLRDDE